MGGRGSGNWYRVNKKPTQEAFWRFSAAHLKKHGVIKEGAQSSGVWSWLRNSEVGSRISYVMDMREEPAWLRVMYHNKSTGEEYDYKIRLSNSRPHYGGTRWWLHCPGNGCGRRVAVLYLRVLLLCRHCHGLRYASQSEGLPFRLLDKAQKIHHELGGSGVVDDVVVRPKGMHRKTYDRKIAVMRNLHHHSMLEAVKRFG